MYVYTVMDYDWLSYAGTSFKKAQQHVKGAGLIHIWKDGRYVGVGEWNTKTKKWIKKFF